MTAIADGNGLVAGVRQYIFQAATQGSVVFDQQDSHAGGVSGFIQVATL
jgi:hypothetical protein